MQVRTLLRRMSNVMFEAVTVQQSFHVPLSEAEAIIEGLAAGGVTTTGAAASCVPDRLLP